MKINSRLINRARSRRNQGFTLIEMIGVIAVIAILAAMLVPKIFEAINNARVNNAAMSCQTVNIVFDGILLGEGFLDKPFATKIGDGLAGTTVRVDLAEAAATAPAASTGAGGAGDASYTLDGGTTAATFNKATGSAVVHAIITGVSLNDARDLNTRIDGTEAALGEGNTPAGGDTSDATATDLAGRVKYKFTAGSATTTMYVYLTHR